MSFDRKYQNQQKSSDDLFAISNGFRDINGLNFWPLKVGQGHEIQSLQWRHSMANIKIYKHLFTFFIFAEEQPVLNRQTQTDRRTDREADRQTDEETVMDKPLARGEIMQTYNKKL